MIYKKSFLERLAYKHSDKAKSKEEMDSTISGKNGFYFSNISQFVRLQRLRLFNIMPLCLKIYVIQKKIRL